jgi:hypothetical protein
VRATASKTLMSSSDLADFCCRFESWIDALPRCKSTIRRAPVTRPTRKFVGGRCFFGSRALSDDLAEDTTLQTIAGWVAPIVTMIAVNRGARASGWSLVVFTIGSICGSIVSLDQTNLLATNVFLALVNLLGIWRWLGRQRACEDGGGPATHASHRSSGPTLFAATGSAGMQATDPWGVPLGSAVEALVECASGQVSYIVVASGGSGGFGKRLCAVPRAQIEFRCDRLVAERGSNDFERLPALGVGDWPDRAPNVLRTSA